MLRQVAMLNINTQCLLSDTVVFNLGSDKSDK